MKVLEKGTDRRAEVNLYMDGKVHALEEYGEYIDGRDKAICCYVPVYEGERIKIHGKFFGTTLTVAHDAIVDGVLRKSHTFTAKSVSVQRSRKLDVDTFLYNTDAGIVDTEMHVAPLSKVITLQGEEPENVGTLELRLYVTRQFNVFHAVDGIDKYYASQGDIEDDTIRTAHFKQIVPRFQMMFEKNAAPLSKREANAEHRKTDARRPGIEPWVIFRFHYRSIDEIMEQNLEMTFDPVSTEKTDPRTLLLEPVPQLLLGSVPKRDSDDSSTRASSSLPPDLTSTPVNSAREVSVPRSPTSSKRQNPKPTTLRTSTNEDENSMTLDTETNPNTVKDVIEDLRAQLSHRPLKKPPAKSTATTTPIKATTGSNSDKTTTPFTSDGLKSTAVKNTGDDLEVCPAVNSAINTNITTQTPVNKPVDTLQSYVQDSDKDTIVVAVPKAGTNGLRKMNGPKVFGLSNSHPDLSTSATADKVSPATLTTQRGSQSASTPANRSNGAVVPDSVAKSTVKTKLTASAQPVTPAKRPIPHINGTTPEPKRTKPDIAPLTPVTHAIVPQNTPRSPSAVPMSIERQVREQRRRLEELRKKREETAKKQSEIDAQMKPYKEHMAKELERLNAELMEEETAYNEDQEHYSASVEMLTEFKQVNGGN